MKLLDLDAYVTGELADADAFEEAMFDAPDDPNLRFLAQLAHHGKRLAAHGTFDVGVSRAHIDQLLATGHALHVVDAGGPTDELRVLSIPAGGDLLATSLLIGPVDVDRVDVELDLYEHGVTKVLKDVVVDHTEGRIYALCERPLAELAMTAGPTRTTVKRSNGTVIATWHLHGQLEARGT